ncbi:MAG: suppressor of fused domain protein [Chloroflexota bacterium]|nr:suppressor of fused domain protein [Chloroflexota bacterium]
MATLEQVWAHREEVVYPNIFGSIGEGIYPLSADLFSSTFRQESIDPRWLHVGVFQCPPTNTRPSWIYISSGLSNPWDDEPEAITAHEYSGLGVEFVLETPEAAQWAIIILQRMVGYEILLAHGRFGDMPPLDYGHRIPLRGSIALNQPSELHNLLIVEPDHYPASFDLASGRVDFLHFIGITDTELAYAKASSSADLAALLKAKRVYPMTNPTRSTIV